MDQTSIAWIFAISVMCLFMSGCRDARPTRLYPVSGRVFVKGRPAAGAELAFYGTDERLQTADAPIPRATVHDDGTFEVTSLAPADGAPTGNYVVTIVWRRSLATDPELREQSPDLLRGRYATPQTSTITVDVKPEVNVLLDIEL